MDFYSFDVAAHILQTYKRWAIVGCSSDRFKPSHGVARFLSDRGYEITPVNPNEDEVLGLRCYPDLASVPDEAGIEVVDIFRRPEDVGPHVDEAIEIGARAVWMQLGVVDEGAARRAADAGLDVVMDHCPRIDLPRLLRASA